MVRVMMQILILALLLGVIPFLAGGLFVRPGEGGKLLFRWVSGQMLLWAGFQLICVPLILWHQGRNFIQLCVMFGFFLAVTAVLALTAAIRRKEKIFSAERRSGRDKAEVFLWLLVLALLALQMVLAATMAYEEGDDAYYVAVSVVTESSDTMYQILPYTGFATGLDARHGLAPFPVWVAFLSRLSGIHAAIISQVILPVILIAMSYSVFFLIGRRLVGEKRRGLPLFMLFIELLVIFGGQSLYTSENFLLVRTAQGKAVLANIVIPFLLWLLLVMAQQMQDGGRVGIRYWLLVGATMISGCLCSVQGALLTGLLLVAGGICAAVCYRRWRGLLPLAVCCIVPAAFLFLYLALR